MPRLRHIDCSIELGSANQPRIEYDTTYRDSAVNCYIVTPENDLPFNIHITAENNIASGIAAWVYIDGVYQCNRNKPTGSVATEFRLRQKEDKLSDGSYIGREWTFAKLVRKQENAKRDKKYEKNVGKIEVIIRRCVYENDVGREGTKRSQTSKPVIVTANAASKKGDDKEAEEDNIIGDLFDGTYEWDPHNGIRAPYPHCPSGPDYRQHAQPGWPAQQYHNQRPHSLIPGSRDWIDQQMGRITRNPSILKDIDIDPDLIIKLLRTDQFMQCFDFSCLEEKDERYLRFAINEHNTNKSSSRHRKAVDKSSKSDHLADATKSSKNSDKKNKTKQTEESEGWGFTMTKAANDGLGGWTGSNGQAAASSSTSKSSRQSNKVNEGQGVGAGWDTQDAPKEATVIDLEKSSKQANWGANANDNQDQVNTSGFQADTGGNSNTWATEPSRDNIEKSPSEAKKQRQSHSSRQSTTSSASSTASDATIQAYWDKWNQPKHGAAIRNRPRHARDPYIYAALPAPAIASNSKVKANHGVQIGRGTSYEHKVASPVYIDPMESPYAIFTFKYRSRDILQKILGCEIESPSSSTEEKLELLQMSKDDLVDELMRLRKGANDISISERNANGTAKKQKFAGDGQKSQQAQTVKNDWNDAGGARSSDKVEW